MNFYTDLVTYYGWGWGLLRWWNALLSSLLKFVKKIMSFFQNSIFSNLPISTPFFLTGILLSPAPPPPLRNRRSTIARGSLLQVDDYMYNTLSTVEVENVLNRHLLVNQGRTRSPLVIILYSVVSFTGLGEAPESGARGA